MSFLLPIGLFALLALPLILLLHLIRERQRRVQVPSLMLWRNLPRKPAGERARKLPLSLLLLLHLLVAAALGLALARPQLLGAFSRQTEQLAIVLDTSSSMAATDGGATRFAQAEDAARTLLRGIAGNARATLISAGPVAQIIASGSANDVAGFEATLDTLRPGGTGTDINTALTLAEASFDPQRPGRIVVLTDGALPTVPPRSFTNQVDWQQIGAAQSNRAIINFAARATGGALQVYARVANYDDAPFNASVRLFADDKLNDTRAVTIAANGESELAWKLPSDVQTMRAEIDGGDGLPLDDVAFLSVATPRPTNVLLVSAQPDVLRRALTAIPGVTIVAVAPDAYDAATEAQRLADLTVLDGTLPAAWPAGATLAINPPADTKLITTIATPRLLDGELTQRGVLLNNLSFGGVNFNLVPTIEPPAWASVQLAAGDVPLILRGRSDNHEIALWSFDLQESNLKTRLAFPLLLARTVRDLTPTALPTSLQAGAALNLHPATRATTIQITKPDKSIEQANGAASLTFNDLTQPGVYHVVEQGPSGALFDGRVAVNAGAAIESDLRPQPAPTLNGGSASVGSDAQQRVTELWPWLALAGLLVLLGEWVYIHR